MPSRTAYADVKLDVDPEAHPLTATLDPETPFRILLMGDFGGGSRGKVWKPVEIDRDNFEEVLTRLDVGVARLSLVFRELDDFHPDQIYRGRLFENMRQVRSKLESPATFAEAASEIRRWRGDPGATAEPAIEPPAGGSLLDSILGAATAPPPPRVKPLDPLQSFVDRVAARSTVPATSPDMSQVRALFDAEASDRMRALLHHPAFQAVEAAWRAVYRLVRAVETGPLLKIYLLDVSRAELADDLGAADVIGGSQAWRAMVETESWAVVVGNYAFGTTAADASMLGRLGAIMQASGAPLLAEADPRHDVSEEWTRLRRSAAARWVGLAMPRFLLRVPYGKNSNSIDSFDFEEFPGVPEHPHYLWGNPAFVCAEMLAEAFSDGGWEMSPGRHTAIRGLPLHIFEADGEKQVKPCAETLLTERETEWILDQGFMPLVSLKDRDIAHLLRFQSIADPAAALGGRWGK